MSNFVPLANIEEFPPAQIFRVYHYFKVDYDTSKKFYQKNIPTLIAAL